MRIGIIGTGILGSAAARKLKKLKHEVLVTNRTLAKAKALESCGIEVKGSPAELIEAVDTVILMLPDGPAIGKVLFKELERSFQGKTFIQMGTISPEESRNISSAINDRQGQYLECPVLGSRGETDAGRLILLLGGSEAQFVQFKDLLKPLGQKYLHIGPVGSAAAFKLALNQLIVMQACAFSLSLGIIQKKNIDVGLFMEAVRNSAVYAPMFDKKLDNWLQGNYDDPNFSVDHLLKDINLIRSEAESLNLETEVIKAAQRLYEKAVEQGIGQKDYSSIYQVINSG